MVWVAFAIMTAAAVLSLVWPLAGKGSFRRGRAADIDFYKSQLAEVEDDIGRGLVSPADAEATRAEIVRRLLLSAGQDERPADPGGFRLRRLAALAVAVVVVPVLALGLYLQIGHPSLPDLPIAARNATSSHDIEALIPKIEAHLVADPNDGRGFSLIAPIYLRLGRFDDAARAYRATLRILGENAERRASLGQALVMAADGVVTAEARADFDQALSDDPKSTQARFFIAASAEQDGAKGKALDLWRQLAADSAPDAPWLPAVQQHIAALGGQPVPAGAAPANTAPEGPDTAAGAGIAAMPPEQRIAAIRGMVEGLAGRLAQNGRDPQGWLRLVRAYSVLGDQAKARTALGDARKVLSDDSAALSQLGDLARQLGLEG
jgi:cytochrome c-type biogenesis protein CcmH